VNARLHARARWRSLEIVKRLARPRLAGHMLRPFNGKVNLDRSRESDSKKKKAIVLRCQQMPKPEEGLRRRSHHVRLFHPV
jgi:hypothetical protein